MMIQTAVLNWLFIHIQKLALGVILCNSVLNVGHSDMTQTGISQSISRSLKILVTSFHRLNIYMCLMTEDLMSIKWGKFCQCSIDCSVPVSYIWLGRITFLFKNVDCLHFSHMRFFLKLVLMESVCGLHSMHVTRLICFFCLKVHCK